MLVIVTEYIWFELYQKTTLYLISCCKINSYYRNRTKMVLCWLLLVSLQCQFEVKVWMISFLIFWRLAQCMFYIYSQFFFRLMVWKPLTSILWTIFFWCRVAVSSRFQHSFMQLLYDAQFEELSERDLMLTSALNTDYLLTLPVYVDWKRSSESNAIIFRWF